MSNRISCTQCDKTFRTESGLSWHLEHIHDQHQPKLSPDKAVLKETVKEVLKEETERAYQSGYEQARQEWQVWYFCDVCGERLNISPDGDSHKAVINYMREHGWGHNRCHKKT